MIAARLFGKSKLCLRSASLGIQIPVMHSYKVSVAHCSTGVRITEDSWAADELKAQGMKLEPAEPVTELIVLSDHLLLNPSEKVVKLVEEITSLNMVEVKQFAARMAWRLGLPLEACYGVPGGGGGFASASGGAGGGASAAAAEPAKVKDSFDLKLTEVSAAAKIKIIKEVRVITGLGLKEAKELVEKAPVVVKQGLAKGDADNFMKLIVEAGGKAELV